MPPNRLRIPKSEFVGRVNKIKVFMNKEKLNVLLVYSAPRSHRWTQTGHTDYITNWSNPDRIPECLVVIPLEDEPILLLAGVPYMLDAVRQVSWIKDIRLASSGDVRAVASGYEKESGHDGDIKDFGQVAKGILDSKGGKVGLIGIENMPLPVYNSLRRAFRDELLENVKDILAELRMVKSKGEIAIMKEVAKLSDLGFQTLVETAREGMWGYEVQAEVEREVRSKGADFVHYWMASGPGEGWKNFIPDLKAHARRLRKDDQIVACSYVVYEGYWAHGMRAGTLGKPSDQQTRLFRKALKIQGATIEIMKPGVPPSKVFRTAVKATEEMGFALHGGRTGHGIGLDYSEKPFFVASETEPIKAGATAVIHPALSPKETGGFYIPLGDVCLVTEEGTEFLTEFPRVPFRA